MLIEKKKSKQTASKADSYGSWILWFDETRNKGCGGKTVLKTTSQQTVNVLNLIDSPSAAGRLSAVQPIRVFC